MKHGPLPPRNPFRFRSAWLRRAYRLYGVRAQERAQCSEHDLGGVRPAHIVADRDIGAPHEMHEVWGQARPYRADTLLMRQILKGVLIGLALAGFYILMFSRNPLISGVAPP